MTMINEKIGLQKTHDANAFLRSLWAQLRLEFKDVSGLFSPQKVGAEKKVCFGTVQLEKEIKINVYITYSTRGSLENIVFSDEKYQAFYGKVGKEVFTRIRKCINLAKDSFKNPNRYRLSNTITLNSMRTFMPMTKVGLALGLWKKVKLNLH